MRKKITNIILNFWIGFGIGFFKESIVYRDAEGEVTGVKFGAEPALPSVMTWTGGSESWVCIGDGANMTVSELDDPRRVAPAAGR